MWPSQRSTQTRSAKSIYETAMYDDVGTTEMSFPMFLEKFPGNNKNMLRNPNLGVPTFNNN